MDISFDTRKLQVELNDAKACRRRYGGRANRLRQRLDDLAAAANLAVMRGLPGNCHELTANLKGQIAISVDGPYRLIFEPANEPLPLNGSGGLDWARVTEIRILRIEDYHNG